jgi:hypothetical protein
MPDDDRTERLGDRDGLVRRAVVDDEDGVGMPPGADDGLCDVGLLVVGGHRNEGPDGTPNPHKSIDEEGCVVVFEGRTGGRRDRRLGGGGALPGGEGLGGGGLHHGYVGMLGRRGVARVRRSCGMRRFARTGA